MTALQSWLATLGVVGILFVVGRFLQRSEVKERLTKKAEQAIREQEGELYTQPSRRA